MWKTWVSNRSVKPVWQGGWRGGCWWPTVPTQRSSAGNLRAVFFQGLRLLRPASTACSVSQRLTLIRTGCLSSLDKRIAGQRLWYSHVPPLPRRWVRRYQQLCQIFTRFCLLFATAVVGGGCGQPAHRIRWIFNEDELPLTRGSLRKPLRWKRSDVPMTSPVVKKAELCGRPAAAHAPAQYFLGWSRRANRWHFAVRNPPWEMQAADSKQWGACCFWSWTRSGRGERCRGCWTRRGKMRDAR